MSITKKIQPYHLISVILVICLVVLVGFLFNRFDSSPIRNIGVPYLGSMPNWSIDEMMDRSDAVVIGTITRELGSKEIPIGSDDGRNLISVVVDYEVEVENVLLPTQGDFPTMIAVSTTGEKRFGDSLHAHSVEHPAYKTNERVLFFLERLPESVYSDFSTFTVPQGFNKEAYFNHLISDRYGKLTPSGTEWVDSRTQISISSSEIEDAASRSEANQSR